MRNLLHAIQVLGRTRCRISASWIMDINDFLARSADSSCRGPAFWHSYANGQNRIQERESLQRVFWNLAEDLSAEHCNCIFSEVLQFNSTHFLAWFASPENDKWQVMQEACIHWCNLITLGLRNEVTSILWSVLIAILNMECSFNLLILIIILQPQIKKGLCWASNEIVKCTRQKVSHKPVKFRICQFRHSYLMKVKNTTNNHWVNMWWHACIAQSFSSFTANSHLSIDCHA